MLHPRATGSRASRGSRRGADLARSLKPKSLRIEPAKLEDEGFAVSRALTSFQAVHVVDARHVCDDARIGVKKATRLRLMR